MTSRDVRDGDSQQRRADFGEGQLGEQHLRRVLAGYFAYYHGSRTHLSLAKDAPTPRRVQGVTEGDVIAIQEVGGLHHR